MSPESRRALEFRLRVALTLEAAALLSKWIRAQVKSIKAWPVDERTEVGVEVDGETPGTLPARFEVCPASLTVRVPAE